LPARARPLLADIVAKVGEGHLRRNNRIGTTSFLNQHCVSALDLESILLVWMRKIFLQQYLHKAVTCPRYHLGPFLGE
jgi:hypothetical protein